MSRPKGFDRDTALALLMEDIWEHGYEACSVKSMSENLGITRSSFYNAFGSKEKLFAEVLGIYRQSKPGKNFFEINGSKSVLSTITESMFEICRYQEQDTACRGCLAASSIQNIVKKNDALEIILKDFFNKNIEHFEELIRLAINRGEIEGCDTRIKALSLQTVLIGLSEMSKIFRKKGELWSICKHSLKALDLHGEFEQKFEDRPRLNHPQGEFKL
ncbi:MAG: TetR/AcrR family transcriptional regulator [Porticoccaceae bacterium]|nr:TetR/AcrR family transcriptional regulator [Porticoccaceae bacterium]